MLHTQTNRLVELTFTAAKRYAAPEVEVELDAVITTPGGAVYKRPGFWNGGDEWRIRFAADETGQYTLRTECSNAADSGLHGHKTEVTVAAYDGENPLLKHGSPRIAATGRTLQHADGTPFFWLADTWWMGLCKRLEFPGEFDELLADRVKKGFSVVHIVAGLYPDMDPFDRRGENEAGFPWATDFSRINPDYFQLADARIERIVRAGISPCIVGCWGYYLHAAGPPAIQRHWRYLVARYGAWPVTWCLCGEALMTHYTQVFESDAARETHIAWLHSQWSEVGRYVRQLDADRHPLTVHPGGPGHSTRQMVEDDVYDFVWLQTGHDAPGSYPGTRRAIETDYNATPVKPVINSEVCYEGILETCRQEAQRYLFWSCMLGGAAGHSYGANGIWQLNRQGAPYGPSPHGLSWGDTPWDEAYKLLGSLHVGVGKKILERYHWHRFAPHPEWVQLHQDHAELLRATAAGIPGEIRVVYWPNLFAFAHPVLLQLEPEVRYRATLVDPITGADRDLAAVEPTAEGTWSPPFNLMPRAQDWVFVLQRVG